MCEKKTHRTVSTEATREHIDADAHYVDEGFLYLSLGGVNVAVFAPGGWSSVLVS